MNPTIRIALLHQAAFGGGTAVPSSTPILNSRVASVSVGSRVASAPR